MKKIILLLLLGVLVVGFYVFNNQSQTTDSTAPTRGGQAGPVTTNYKDATYKIEGQVVTLHDGFSETEAAPGSAGKVITRYFGNEQIIDLNADGVEDIAFVMSQETGGSGTFFYAVGAVKTEVGYVGTDSYLLGDRISPQSTDLSQNPRHKNVVVFNYMDRAEGEPMTTPTSVGKSVYLKLVPETMQWATVEPDFEGESR